MREIIAEAMRGEKMTNTKYGKYFTTYEAKPEEIEDLIKNVGARGLAIVCENITNEQGQYLEEKYGND